MKSFLALSIVLFWISLMPREQISISIQSADDAMIPLSSRLVYATVRGTENLTVRWSVTGGCSLEKESIVAGPDVVTAPVQASSCRLSKESLSNERPDFTSLSSCIVTATSVADPAKKAAIVLPVCKPNVVLTTFPESSVLFLKQFAVIQSDLRGSTDTRLTWSITSNPGKGGSLSVGTSNRHAVFSAAAPGVYVVTAVSQADPRQTASSRIYVTSHGLPRRTTDHTEPVDCTAVGEGQVLEVGPTHKFQDLGRVPWGSLQPGATVRIFNEDMTGEAPTTYHQHISISATGTARQPLRICGVPDAKGIKPILDADHASSPSDGDSDWAGSWLQDLGLIVIYDGAHKRDVYPDGSHNILIEGLHLRNASPEYKFKRQSDGVLYPYGASAACIHVHTGRGVMLRGNELENCAQGIFVNSQTPQGSIVYDLTIEGNYIHDWGITNYSLDHAMYLQAIGLTVQFNYIGRARSGAAGNVVKSRSLLNFLRWNYVNQSAGTARTFDLVEPQGFVCYVNPHGYAMYHTPRYGECNPPDDGADSDLTTADQVASNYESYQSDYVYGNIIRDEGSKSAFVHYGYDQKGGSAFDRRGGTLFYWNNTHLERRLGGSKRIFDPEAPDAGHSYAFPSIVSVNNIFAGTTDTAMYQVLRPFWTRITVDSNWMTLPPSLPDRASEDTYQGGMSAEEAASCDVFGRCRPGQGHMLWKRKNVQGAMADTLYVGENPFSELTFLPGPNLRGLAATLPSAIQDQPSNMVFHPDTGIIAARSDSSVLGALD